MSTHQISKVFNGIHNLATKSSMAVPNGKLNGNSGTFAKESSLASVEEAICWQDKMKETHLNLALFRSEIIRKRSI